MLNNIPDEYEIDPGTDIDRLAEITIEQYPDAIRRSVEEVIFVDEGPIDYLAWVALDDYTRHEIFYYDRDPDQDTLRRLVSWSPNKDEMRLLKAYFAKEFNIIESLSQAAFLEIPDPYLPGSKPSANVVFYHRPSTAEIDIGINATPLDRNEEIFSDVDRVIPAKDLETFARNVIERFYDELITTAEHHVIEGDVAENLASDPNFHQQTTKPLPDGIHPLYTGEAAELWQKPISKSTVVTGSEGFIQVWLPNSQDHGGLVSLTDGDYDTEQTLESVRTAFETTIE
ncbi:hypothetical protein [Haloarcula sp. CGMCC 1.2071]|uniref:hypothetical protein n=1 Tax=Haloarcula sp. CGMCC 1.2071 TaxID=3111454 RepID=UPI00300E8EDF